VTSPIASARDLDAGQRAIPTLSQHTADACQRLAADPEKPTGGNPAGFSASLNFLTSRLLCGSFSSITKQQRGGDSMKIKVNVRAGGTKSLRS
jgi:hypothetical protein